MQRSIRVRREVTPDMIRDLITTFLEDGGFNSWVAGVKFYTWNESNERQEVTYGDTWGDGSTFYEGRWSIDIKTDDGAIHPLGWKRLAWALEKQEMQKRTEAFFDESYDVEDASCIVQMAIFKEIVYG